MPTFHVSAQSFLWNSCLPTRQLTTNGLALWLVHCIFGFCGTDPRFWLGGPDKKISTTTHNFRQNNETMKLELFYMYPPENQKPASHTVVVVTSVKDVELRLRQETDKYIWWKKPAGCLPAGSNTCCVASRVVRVALNYRCLPLNPQKWKFFNLWFNTGNFLHGF